MFFVLLCSEGNNTSKYSRGKKEWLNSQVVLHNVALTGLSAAGKTSFLNLLSREKFTAHHHSTNVAESKQVVYTAGVVGSGKESQWIDLSHENMLRQLNGYLQTHIPTVKHAGIKMYSPNCHVEDDIAVTHLFVQDNASSLGDVWKMVNFLDTGSQPSKLLQRHFREKQAAQK